MTGSVTGQYALALWTKFSLHRKPAKLNISTRGHALGLIRRCASCSLVSGSITRPWPLHRGSAGSGEALLPASVYWSVRGLSGRRRDTVAELVLARSVCTFVCLAIESCAAGGLTDWQCFSCVYESVAAGGLPEFHIDVARYSCVPLKISGAAAFHF